MKKQAMADKLAKKGVKGLSNVNWEKATNGGFDFSEKNPSVAGEIIAIKELKGNNGTYRQIELLTESGEKVHISASSWTRNHFKVFEKGMIVKFDFVELLPARRKGMQPTKKIDVSYAPGVLTEEMKKIIFTKNPKKGTKKKKKAGKSKK